MTEADALDDLRALAMDQMLVLRELVRAVQGIVLSPMITVPETVVNLPAPIVNVSPAEHRDVVQGVTPDHIKQMIDVLKAELQEIARQTSNAPAMTVRGSGVTADALRQAVADGLAAAGSLTDTQLRQSPVPVAVDLELDRFARLLKFEPSLGEEIRRDETLTFDYHGAATDGAATSLAVWDVVRFTKTAGLITRVQFRSGLTWDGRAVGW